MPEFYAFLRPDLLHCRYHVLPIGAQGLGVKTSDSSIIQIAAQFATNQNIAASTGDEKGCDRGQHKQEVGTGTKTREEEDKFDSSQS